MARVARWTTAVENGLREVVLSMLRTWPDADTLWLQSRLGDLVRARLPLPWPAETVEESQRFRMPGKKMKNRHIRPHLFGYLNRHRGEATMKPTLSKATKTNSTFRMACSIQATIAASPDKIWGLLTDESRFSVWNSTVTTLEGRIAEGNTLKITVPSAPGRTFKPRVSKVERGRSMVWSDGMAPMFKGVRTFRLSPNADGSTVFEMEEVFAGIMVPLAKGSLPDFGPIFEAYAADLKRAAESEAS